MDDLAKLRKKEAQLKKLLDSGVRDQLMRITGVTHVSIGLKEVKGIAQDEFCIRVYVAKKKNKGNITKEEMIPNEIKGIKTDVIEVPVANITADTRTYPSLIGGIQLRNPNAGFGTLGCLATDNNTSRLVALTNYHVVASTAVPTGIGQQMLHPDTGGTVVGTVPANVNPATGGGAVVMPGAVINTSVDCARIDLPVSGNPPSPVPAFQNILNNFRIAVTGTGAGVTGARVYKTGRTTGMTRGKIVDANASVSVNYSSISAAVGTVNLTGQMRIQPLFRESVCCCCTCYETDDIFKFSDQGDSGSLVVMSDGTAIGLLFSDNEGGGSKASPHTTHACPITVVETTLNVTVNTTTANLLHPITNLSTPDISIDLAMLAATPAPGEPSKVFFSRGEFNEISEALQETDDGKLLDFLIKKHHREVLELINHNRNVKVTWNRNEGPAFAAHVMNNLKDPNYKMPEAIKGITLPLLLLHMAKVLREAGSPALYDDITRYGFDLMYLVQSGASTAEVLERLNLRTPAQA